MKVFQVGGCVRDRLMGRVPSDYDYVVVGGTHEQMIAIGFEQVGSSFPVYLHPVTRSEFALARQERKTAPGHGGFDVDFNPGVSLEEDLKRRDFTMNAIAYDDDMQAYIDPFLGATDIANKTIRHTSEAFSEDPLRVLRAFRFAVKYGFTIHPTTADLIKTVIPCLDELHVSRIISEFIKLDPNLIRPFVQYCIKYELHKRTRLFEGLTLREFDGTRFFFDSEDEDVVGYKLAILGMFWDVPDDYKIYKTLSISSQFHTALSTMTRLVSSEYDVYEFIKRFRLDKPSHTIRMQSLNDRDAAFIQTCIAAYTAVPIPTSGNIGEQLKESRIAAIRTAMRG